jgi:mRNA interferase YafQ
MTMLDFSYSPRFKKEIKQAVFQGRDILKILPPLFALMNEQPLPSQYEDHPLKGSWNGYRELHIEPDWLIIYRKTDKTLVLERTGSHTDLLKT